MNRTEAGWLLFVVSMFMVMLLAFIALKQEQMLKDRQVTIHVLQGHVEMCEEVLVHTCNGEDYACKAMGGDRR